MDSNKLLNLAFDVSQSRIENKNFCNGKAYMSCVIISKDRSCVLRKRNKLLQY